MASRPASRNLEGGLAALLLGYTAICCASLIYVAGWYPEFHIFFDPLSLHHAALALSVLTAISFFFSIGEFSFGYFVSFYLYNLVMGYIWAELFLALRVRSRSGSPFRRRIPPCFSYTRGSDNCSPSTDI